MSHAVAVQLAEAAQEALKHLFDAVGGVERPQGALWRAYRVGRAALGEAFSLADLQDVQTEVAASVQETARQLVSKAADQGATLASQQLDAYGATAPAADTGLLEQNALAVILGELAQQQEQITTLYAVTGDPSLIVGDSTHVGLFGPALAAQLLTRWLTTTHQAAFAATVQRSPQAERFKRQAVATLSRRTTNCCLQVHGQIVGLDEPFVLTGTPRYADKMLHAPFHRYCRTVEALVPARGGDDELTQTMRKGADAELEARERGGTTQQHQSGTALEP